ncbi:DUF2062 domain-containing protein [Candidatus Altiarchaeota archaeon]
MRVVRKGFDRVGEHLTYVIKVKKSPHSIALGFALGFFLGSLPLPGFSIFLALLITIIYPRISKIALAAVLLAWGFASAAPFYMLSNRIGESLFGPAPVVEYELNMFYEAYHFTRRFLAGFMILITLISISIYAVIRSFLEMVRLNDHL